MRAWIGNIFKIPVRFNMWGSLAIVLFATSVVSGQVTDRTGFANGALYEDVMERWGTPIDQPAPSVRYVASGTVFNSLKPLVLDSQKVKVGAKMNYRKRGLVYFSGFDLSFTGSYSVANPEERDIDIVFVFPVALDRNKVLLSELDFSVNGENSAIQMSDEGDNFIWTGRLKKGESAAFVVKFKGRGLDAFTYRLDPAFAVRNFSLEMDITGGDNFDYPRGVVPAHVIQESDDVLHLAWTYPSLESGVPVGAILPSEKSFDEMIQTMARRSWAPFLLFVAGLIALATLAGRKMRFWESYLVASGFGFFFVLLAYLAAYMNFYVAYVLANAIIIILLAAYARLLISNDAGVQVAWLLVALLTLPSLAVVIEGHTGLIYSLEILAGLAGVMLLTTKPGFSMLVAEIMYTEEEVSDVA